MHQGATLVAREDGRVKLFRQIFVIGQDNAAPRTAQRFMGGGGDHMSMRHRVWVMPGANQAGIVGHIDHQISTNFVGDGAKRGEINFARIGGCPGNDKFWFGFTCDATDIVHINQMGVFADFVGNNIKPFARHGHVRAMGEVPAMGKRHAHDPITGLEQGKENRLIGLRP